MNKQQQIQELLSRGVEEVINRAELEKQLMGKQKLRIKFGIDPTSPNIHIGRAVVLWKLRAFQDLGHTVVFIVGDFTGIIGDTSDKDAERPMLTEAQVKQNLKTYFAQAYKILDKSKTETHYNSKWLKKLGFKEIGHMADLFGLHEFESRENIAKRLKAGKRVSLRELLYPLMQGYDSVAVKADVELGGTDQRFNLLAGRTMQPAYKQKPQHIVTMQLMEGTDGRKMSSSWGNVINVTDNPGDMFGKVMSIADSLIPRYFLLATNIAETEIQRLLKDTSHPRDQKLLLAEQIVRQYHGDKEATTSRDAFISRFTNKELPTDIPQVTIKPGTYQLAELLVMTNMAGSKSEARRLISQNGVKLNSETAHDTPIEIGKKNNLLVQVGKRKIVKIQ
jgi:tyrosyl-tRNA synthetase